MTSDHNDRQSDPTGPIASFKAASEKPYLGDNAVLDELVRKLAGDVFERFDKCRKGELTSAQASDADQEACRELARILVGQNVDYVPVPGWTDYELATSIRRKMNGAARYEDDVSVVEQAVNNFVRSIYPIIHEQEDPAKQEAVRDQINESIRSFVRLLLA